MTDTEILYCIDKCIDNDRSAQKHLYDVLAPRMFSLCIRYTGDRDVAEDVLQEGFITLFSKLSTYKKEGAFEGWARRIFVNTSLMYLRKKDALKMSEDLKEAENISSTGTTQMQHLGYKELIEMIKELPDGFRTVFNMYVVEGYSHKEIADLLDISETTSRTQLSRARNCLKQKIEKNRNGKV